MKIRTLFSFLLIPALFSAQPEVPSFIYTESNIFPGDSLYKLYFSYKIPFNRLVFEKRNSEYAGGIRVSIEVKNDESEFVTRDIREKKLSARSFDETNADDLYAEGLLSFNLPEGKYELFPVFTDLNTQQELRLPPVKTEISVLQDISPVIVEKVPAECEENEYKALANFNSTIPFGREDYEIVIPVAGQDSTVFITAVSNGRDTVYKGKTALLPGDFELRECSEKILLQVSESGKRSYFILNDISRKLKEGYLTIYLSGEEKVKPDDTVKIKVKWHNKPNSLLDPEIAVRFLKYIEQDSVISRLLKSDDMKLYQALSEYWERTDPTPDTEFNELMEEYYRRLDYVQSNFSIITGKKGADTDRGKVYIRFGRPEKIERGSDEYGKVVETWIYRNPQRKFVFIDRSGLGEFSLQKG